MIKYFRAIIYIFYSLVKFLIIKLFNVKGFKFSLINVISPFTQIDINRRAFLTLGKMVRISSGSKLRVRNGAIMEIGENTFLNNGCIFTAHEKIYIGTNVQFGPNVYIYDHDHDFRSENGLKDLKYKTSPVIIGDNVWIGANTVILRGTTIGDNSVIAAGSVIKGNYERNSIIIQKRETLVSKF
nr:acyltransferase [Paenibacillus bovis]